MTIEEIKHAAAEVAAAMQTHGDALPLDVRALFLDVRTALFNRGVFDPVLSRFDSATQPRAANTQIAEELAKIAESLR